ncbi:MAG TPA: EAL domain-containing protein, partial [Bacillota bacterium]|nr:EAL domain-containing protein [Bacillota bacterium]
MLNDKKLTTTLLVLITILFFVIVNGGLMLIETLSLGEEHEQMERLYVFLVTLPFIFFSSIQYLQLQKKNSLSRETTKIQEMVVKNRPLNEVLDLLARLLESHLNGPKCLILISDIEEENLVYGAGPSFPQSFIDKLNYLPISPNSRSCGTAAFRRERVVVYDIAEDPLWENWRDEVLPYGVRSCWSNPIFSSTGRVIGTFGLFFHQPKFPYNREISLIERYTSLAGIIIEHYQRAEKLEEIVKKSKVIFNQSNDSIFLYELDDQTDNPRFLDVNDTACERLGYSRAELLQMGLRDIIAPNFVDKIPSILHALKVNKQFTSEWEQIRKDGTTLIVEASRRVITLQDKEIVLSISRDITRRKKSEKEIQYLATYDSLTGLLGRSGLHQRLEQEIQMAQLFDSTRQIGVMVIDLDRFKLINDSFGHPFGDKVLKGFSSRLLHCLDAEGILSRLGGDEFTIIVAETNQERMVQLAERILELQETPIFVEEQELYLSASIGISFYPDHATDSHTLMKNADVAMYQAKKSGTNLYRVYQETDSVERFMIEHELRKALLNEEFELHYQPRVDLETGLVTSVEALIRWNHPIRGRVSPDQFIPVAEETGLIVPLGRWVMRTACQQAKVWQRDCVIPLSVSVNLSTLQLQSHKLQETVQESLAESGLEGKYLELEITESSLMHDITSVIRILNDLKEFGISISVDDFGTGYSSLKYLQLLPVDALKIDKS